MPNFRSGTRTRKLYIPNSEAPFEISRSKIDLFLNCARCFYLDRRLGIGRPSGPPFTLNSAVDTLLKKEFDVYRAAGTPHPLMTSYGISAIPIPHPELDSWRHNFTGIRFLYEPTNLIIYGAIDDLWKNKSGEYIVVDYKATSKATEVNLDADWQIGYKRQMEIYQWLLRMKGLTVSQLGYFVYCNGKTDKKAFDGKLEFDIKVIPYTGDDGWILPTIASLHKCLNGEIPKANDECEYCRYRNAAHSYDNEVILES